MKDLFYKTKVRYKNRTKLISLITDNYLKNPNQKPNVWSDNVHSSIVYDNTKNIEEYCCKSNIPIDLVVCLSKYLQKFLNKKKIQTAGNFYISEIWYNAYKNRQFQYMHKHSNGFNTVFSGVYYLKYDYLQHSPTRFYHPGFEIDFDKVKQNPYFVYTPDVKEDDLIIFPSDIGHDVPNQNSSDLRITVSFNVECNFNDQFNYS